MRRACCTLHDWSEWRDSGGVFNTRTQTRICVDCGEVQHRYAPHGKSDKKELSAMEETTHASSSKADDVRVKDSGQRRELDTGSRRDVRDGKGRFDLIQWRAIRLVARQLEEGAKKYGERNWEKGQPLSWYVDSATRHIGYHMEGRTDERHDVAAAWNILCLLDTSERIRAGELPAELADLPTPSGM